MCHACGVRVRVHWRMRAQVCLMRVACVPGSLVHACASVSHACGVRVGVDVHACAIVDPARGVRVGVHSFMRSQVSVIRVACVHECSLVCMSPASWFVSVLRRRLSLTPPLVHTRSRPPSPHFPTSYTQLSTRLAKYSIIGVACVTLLSGPNRPLSTRVRGHSYIKSRVRGGG